jgi:hypothetical protein
MDKFRQGRGSKAALPILEIWVKSQFGPSGTKLTTGATNAKNQRSRPNQRWGNPPAQSFQALERIDIPTGLGFSGKV